MDEVLIRVSFEAKNTDELKLKIQEYSLAHLGLNLVQISELRKPLDQSTPPPRKRGRQLGWRKNKASEPGIEPKESRVVESMSITQSAAEPLPQASGLTREDAKNAIHRLNATKGFQIAAKALAKFDANHLNQVSETHYGALITHCEELINEPGPDGTA